MPVLLGSTSRLSWMLQTERANFMRSAMPRLSFEYSLVICDINSGTVFADVHPMCTPYGGKITVTDSPIRCLGNIHASGLASPRMIPESKGRDIPHIFSDMIGLLF
jgi:hypothetical protein